MLKYMENADLCPKPLSRLPNYRFMLNISEKQKMTGDWLQRLTVRLSVLFGPVL